MEREEGPDVGDGVDSGCVVVDGVGRGRVGVFDDDRGLFPSLSRYPWQLQPERESTMAMAVAKCKTLVPTLYSVYVLPPYNILLWPLVYGAATARIIFSFFLPKKIEI